MTFHFTPKTLFGAVAMLSLGAALAAGQDTSKVRPRSDRRVPISKEVAGEVVTPRIDTVTVYHTDTIQLTTRVTDTVRVTRTRIDTVIPRLPAYHFPRGFFGGAAGGFSVPTGSLYVPNSTGGSAQIQIGWLNAKQVLGGRFDWNGSWPGPDSRFSAFNGKPNLQNFSLDLKAQYPFNFGGQRLKDKTDPCEPATTYTRGPYMRFAVYGIGGFTYTTYKNLPMRINSFDSFDGLDSVTVITANGIAVIRPSLISPNDRIFLDGSRSSFFVLGDDDSHSRGGWNAGGGASMFWGRAELFVEARVIGFKPHSFRNVNIDASMARQIPVVLGLNWY